MAEADDSGDHIAKEKAKYRYKKKFIHGKWRMVGTPIKQSEPYKTSYGSIITDEPKPIYKKRKIPKKYANQYKHKRKKYE